MAAPDRCPDETPRELYKAALPEYRIEPPDILSIEAVRLLPSPDYTLHVQDVVTVAVFVSAETPLFNVDPAEFVVGIDGTIDLGPTYGIGEDRRTDRRRCSQGGRSGGVQAGESRTGQRQLPGLGTADHPADCRRTPGGSGWPRSTWARTAPYRSSA